MEQIEQLKTMREAAMERLAKNPDYKLVNSLDSLIADLEQALGPVAVVEEPQPVEANVSEPQETVAVVEQPAGNVESVAASAQVAEFPAKEVQADMQPDPAIEEQTIEVHQIEESPVEALASEPVEIVEAIPEAPDVPEISPVAESDPNVPEPVEVVQADVQPEPEAATATAPDAQYSGDPVTSTAASSYEPAAETAAQITPARDTMAALGEPDGSADEGPEILSDEDIDQNLEAALNDMLIEDSAVEALDPIAQAEESLADALSEALGTQTETPKA